LSRETEKMPRAAGKLFKRGKMQDFEIIFAK